jgi:hypothetical protein
MTEFRDSAKVLAATAMRLAHIKGATTEAALLGQARAGLIETGYDNWNGGTDFYTLTLEIPIEAYARVESERERLEASILKRVQDLTRAESGRSITQVVISPELESLEQVAPGEATGVEEALPGFWAPGHFRLFVSHCARVRRSAHNLKVALASYQIAAFVAHDDIEPTREWEAEIESALRTMDALAAIITPDFVNSKWCDQEVGFAMGRGKLVVPIRAGADPHGFLGKYQGMQAKDQTVEALGEAMFAALLRNEQSAGRMTDVLIGRLASVNSWDAARRTMTMLEKVPRLNRSQSARMVQAIEQNPEVKDAHGVPARIAALVGKIGEPDAT